MEAAREEFFRQKEIKIDVCRNVAERYMNDGESRSADLHKKLWAYFERMPVKYAMLAKYDANVDVLEHKKLLDEARALAGRPRIHVKEFEVHPSDESTKQKLYEITCATSDSPGLLLQFTTAFGSMRLTIKEASMLSTTDGYSLLVFLVLSTTDQTQAQLSRALKKELVKANQRRVGTVQVSHDPENPQPTNQSERSPWFVAAEIIYYGGSVLLALYFGVVGAIMAIKGKQPNTDFVNLAVKVGSGLLGNESTETKDIGIALAFVGVPLVGVASILALFSKAIYTTMQASQKFLILWWLLLDILLGIWYPFLHTKTRLMSKVADMFSMLSTILAAVTGFYRKQGH